MVQGDYGTPGQVHSWLQAGLGFKPRSPRHQSPICLPRQAGGSQQRPDHQEPYKLAKENEPAPQNSGEPQKTSV